MSARACTTDGRPLTLSGREAAELRVRVERGLSTLADEARALRTFPLVIARIVKGEIFNRVPAEVEREANPLPGGPINPAEEAEQAIRVWRSLPTKHGRA